MLTLQGTLEVSQEKQPVSMVVKLQKILVQFCATAKHMDKRNLQHSFYASYMKRDNN